MTDPTDNDTSIMPASTPIKYVQAFFVNPSSAIDFFWNSFQYRIIIPTIRP